MESFDEHSEGSHVLFITVVSARGLPKTTSGVTSNAFIRVKYGAQQRYYTRVVKQSLQPIWNESFVYPYTPSVDSIILTVYDSVSFGRDTLIGDAVIMCPSIESSFAAWKEITPREAWGVKDLGRRIVERGEQESGGQVYVVASLLNPMQLTAISSNAGFSGQNFLRLSKMTSFTSMDNPLSRSPITRQRSFQRQSIDSTVGAFYVYFVLAAVRVRLLAIKFSTWKHATSTARHTSKQLESYKMQLMESKYVTSTQQQKITALEEKLTSRQQERIEGEVAALRARDDIRLALEQAAARADAAEEELCKLLDATEAVQTQIVAPTIHAAPGTVHFFVSTLRRCCNRRLKRKFDIWKWETYLHFNEILNHTRLKEIESQQQINIQRAVLEHSNSLPPPPQAEVTVTKVSLHLLASIVRMCWLRQLKRRFDAWKWETYIFFAEAANHHRLNEIKVLVRRESMKVEDKMVIASAPDRIASPYFRISFILQCWLTRKLRHRLHSWKQATLDSRMSCKQVDIVSMKMPVDDTGKIFSTDEVLTALPSSNNVSTLAHARTKASLHLLLCVAEKHISRYIRRWFGVWKWSMYMHNLQHSTKNMLITPAPAKVASDVNCDTLITTVIPAQYQPHEAIFSLSVIVRDIAIKRIKCAFDVWSWNMLQTEEMREFASTKDIAPPPANPDPHKEAMECITYADGSVEYVMLHSDNIHAEDDTRRAVLSVQEAVIQDDDKATAEEVELAEVLSPHDNTSTFGKQYDAAVLESSIATLQQQVELSSAQIEHYRSYINYVVNKIAPILANQSDINTSPTNAERMSKFPKTVIKKLHDRVGDKSFNYDRKIAFSSALQLVEQDSKSEDVMEEITWQPPPPPPQPERSIDIMVVNPAIEAAMNAVVAPQKSKRKSHISEPIHPPPTPPVSGGSAGDSSEYLKYISEMAKSFDSGSEGQGSNVRVAIRMRPMNSREESVSMQTAVEMTDTHNLTIVDIDTTQEHNYSFDYCFDAAVSDRSATTCGTQEIVFEKLGIEILANAWKGYNTSIFAYGQTGSGKSFSMVGSATDKGIIPRVCHALFHMIDEERRLRRDALFKVEASYLEIYNEKVRDLLDSSKVNLRVREHPTLGVFVEDLSQCAVESYRDVEDLIEMGLQQRTTAATNMNSESSRSHSVFTISIRRETEEFGKSCSRMSKLCLIDLAGSERANATGATGARLKEGANINKSLSTLGRCIAALAKVSTESTGPDGKKPLIPFRESVLTWLLRESLCGNAKTTMLATISPSTVQYGETLSTLRYANSAKQITTRAVINEDPTLKIIEDLRNEVLRLRDQLMNNMSHGDGALQRNLQAAEECLRVHAVDWESKRRAMMKVKSNLLSRRYAVFDGEELTDEQLQHTPQLLALSNDWQLNRSLKVYLPPNKALHIGKRSEASIPDLQVDGVGIDVDHCSLYYDAELHRVYLYTNGISVTYVNGRLLSESEPCTVPLNSRDRLVLGVCSHVFCFLMDESDDVAIPSYSQAIREVVIGRMETEREKHERLAALVWNTWRTPYYRKIFEDMLIDALRAVREATMIAKSMCPSSGVYFEAVSNAPIDISALHSLRINDLFSYNNISFRVRCNCSVGAKNDYPERDVMFSRASQLARQSMAAGMSGNRSSFRKQRHSTMLEISTPSGETMMIFESSLTAFMEGLSALRMLDTSTSGLRQAGHILRHETSPDKSLINVAAVISSTAGVVATPRQLDETSDLHTIICDIGATLQSCGLDQNVYVELFYYFKQHREQLGNVADDYLVLCAVDALESCLYEGILQCFAATEVLTMKTNSLSEPAVPDTSMLRDVMNDLIMALGESNAVATQNEEADVGDWTYHIDESSGRQFAYSAALNESRWM